MHTVISSSGVPSRKVCVWALCLQNLSEDGPWEFESRDMIYKFVCFYLSRIGGWGGVFKFYCLPQKFLVIFKWFFFIKRVNVYAVLQKFSPKKQFCPRYEGSCQWLLNRIGEGNQFRPCFSFIIPFGNAIQPCNRSSSSPPPPPPNLDCLINWKSTN